MMDEAGAEVAPEAGAPEAGAEDATDPPQMQQADEHYEAGADVMDDVDEVEEGKVLSKGDYGGNSPSKKRAFVRKGVWVWIRIGSVSSQTTGQRAGSVPESWSIIIKLCSFFLLDIQTFDQFMASKRARGTAGGSAVGVRHIVQEHDTTQPVLNKDIKRAQGVCPWSPSDTRKRVLGVKVLLRAGARRPEEKLARSITSPFQL